MRIALLLAAATAGSAPAQDLSSLAPADRPAFREAAAIAERTPEVRRARAEHPDLVPLRFTREGDDVELAFASGGEGKVAVELDLRTDRVERAWTGAQADWAMARGEPGAFGRSWNSAWIVIPLGLLFLAPFVDVRRPLRLLHLDLAVLLGFGVSHVLFNRGDVDASVPLTLPVLGYLLVRMLLIGFRPREHGERLVPHVPIRWLAAGAVGLFALRVGLNIADSNVIDVGYASVIGADHITGGDELYGEGFASDPSNGDTYGPLTYLAYVPFVELFGWSGTWDDLPAAHAAAIAFDGLTALALFVLGRRLRGRVLGVALAWAWLAYPYTSFALSTNTNDTLIALLVTLALLLWTSPVGRGVMLGLAGAAKFAPLALAPLFARTDGGLREAAAFAAALVVTLVVVTVPFVPDGGLGELYDRTVGFQAGRESPFALLGGSPVVKLLAANFAVLLLAIPARRGPVQLAALGAAALIALQLALTHWFYLYVVWFAPLVLVALFATRRTTTWRHS